MLSLFHFDLQQKIELSELSTVKPVLRGHIFLQRKSGLIRQVTS